MWSQVGLPARSVLHDKVHNSIGLCVVAREDLERYRGDELADEVQPLLLIVDLFHMNIICWNTLVASCDTFILMLASRPCAKVLHLVHQLVTGFLREHGEPEDIWTRLLEMILCEDSNIVWMNVFCFPVHWVLKDLPQIAVSVRGVVVSC